MLENGTAVNNDHDDFSGSGFVDKFVEAGASVTFTVDAPTAGIKDVTLRYANSDPASTLSVYVNNEKIEQVDLPRTDSWDTWGYQTSKLMLKAGENKITYKIDDGDIGKVNVDYISLPFEPAPGTKYEAELGLLENGAEVNTDHSDYSGTGFLGGFRNAGASVTFTVDVASASSKDVTLRYANSDPASYIKCFRK